MRAVLANDLRSSAYFEAAAKGCEEAEKRGELDLKRSAERAWQRVGHTIADCPVPPGDLDELVNLIEAGTISGKQGKEVFAEMFASGQAVRARSLRQKG